MKKLTIVIPVYNGEKYIKRCLDSVLSNKNIKEVIVINDCSTDGSLKILKEYGSRIKLIDLKENRGVSYARNLGIEKATGDYITFVDVDDYIEPNTYFQMLSKIEKTDADICICNYDEIFEENGKIVNSKYNLDFEELDNESVVKKFLTDDISPAIWDKVYKTKLLKNISFENNLAIGEDILFCLKVFMNCKKATFINERFYHYVQQNTSAMHVISPKLLQFKNVIKGIDKTKYEELENNYAEEFNYFKLEMITRGIHSISMLINKSNKAEGIEYLQHYYNKEDLKNIIKCKYFSKSIKLEILILLVFGIRIHLLLMPIYKIIRAKRR